MVEGMNLVGFLIYSVGVVGTAYGCGRVSRIKGWEMGYEQTVLMSLFWPVLLVAAPLLSLVMGLEWIYRRGRGPSKRKKKRG